MAIAVAKAKAAVAFPAAEVEACLRDELLEVEESVGGHHELDDPAGMRRACDVNLGKGKDLVRAY